MAITKDNVKYVKIEGVEVWAAPDGSIQLQCNDPDETTKKLFWMTFSPKDNSVNHHAPTYRKLAEILEHHGKTVPGRQE